MSSSRKTLLTRGVLFGYGALGTQIFYSLASIPLALSYLSKAEFGLWSLITTLTAYLQLLEFGMTNAFIRHLFECRDTKQDGRYGRLFVASLLSTGIAALLMLLIGGLGCWFAAPLFNIPSGLSADFKWLFLGNMAIASAAMALRMFGIPLYVHQRHDLIQFSQLCTYGILYGVLYFGLRAGWGVYAMLANVFAGFAWGHVFAFITCRYLGFYPPKGTWKLPLRSEWQSVLGFSKNFFILQVGNQLIGNMPMLLLPKLLGLEAAGTWTVCTRPFNILKQILNKPYEYSLPMLCEIYVKGEPQRMARRWAQVSQLILGHSVCIFAVGAANNNAFIHLWVGKHIAWSAQNDWLVGLYFLINVIVNTVFGVVGFDKHFGNTRIAPYIEAAALALSAWWMTPLWGLPGLLAASIISQMMARFWFGLRHLSQISETPIRWLMREAMLRPLLVLPLSAATAMICAHLHTLLPGYAGLLLAASTGTLLSGAIVFFLGVSADVRNEMLQMLLKPLARFKKLKVER